MAGRKWFHLVVEGRTGPPLASFVEVADDAFVAASQKAVKIESSNTIAHIDAPELIVYANRPAFNAKEAPLKGFSRLGGRGEGAKNALIVVVPPRPRSVFAVSHVAQK
uniref:Uncharacterized protein n=1 Tax=Globisporangium ultimum (strain ATCC 200006 / CBS 805.95 / DAOM BR144) TaxID=431595 RepID=K3X6Q7_GLOUD